MGLQAAEGLCLHSCIQVIWGWYTYMYAVVGRQAWHGSRMALPENIQVLLAQVLVQGMGLYTGYIVYIHGITEGAYGIFIYMVTDIYTIGPPIHINNRYKVWVY